jgi:thiol-disulfide isomerase/thioredoxin
MGKGRTAALTVLAILLVGALGALTYRMIAAHDAPKAPSAAAAAEEAYGKFTRLAKPQPAPDVVFMARSGETMHLSGFRGKVLLVNLWATWCTPCVKEMPSLDRLQARLGNDLTILAISEDRRGAEAVEPFLEDHRLTALATYYDRSNALLQAFAASGLPTTFLIDRGGAVIGRLEGATDWDSQDMVQLLSPYLAPAQPALQKASLTR